VQTDGTTRDNKPIIIIRDNEKWTRVSIDVAISGDRNVIKNEIRKYSKITNTLQQKYSEYGK
jgi:hypothetical protein